MHPVTIGYIVVAGVLFFWLAMRARRVPYLPLDLSIAVGLQKVNSRVVSRFFRLLDYLGYPPQVNFVVGTIIAIIYLLGFERESLAALFGALGDTVLYFATSTLIVRPRPDPRLIRSVGSLSRSSFPSGHVILDTILFGFIAHVAASQPSPDLITYGILFACALIVIFIGPARVYSGQHWPSDVIAGYLSGSIWLIVTIQFYQWITTFP